MDTYYIIVEEWNYPAESGREPVLMTFNAEEDASRMCRTLADGERDNFARNTVEADGIASVTSYGNGYLLSVPYGSDPFYYYARYIAIPGIRRDIMDRINAAAGKSRTRLVRQFKRWARSLRKVNPRYVDDPEELIAYIRGPNWDDPDVEYAHYREEIKHYGSELLQKFERLRGIPYDIAVLEYKTLLDEAYGDKGGTGI